MVNITFLAAENCLYSGISGLMDAFSIANLWHMSISKEDPGPLFNTEIVTPGGCPVSVMGGVKISPNRAMEDVKETDMIVLPSLLPHLGEPPDRIKEILDWIVVRYKRGNTVAALCTGVFLLAETGLLDGRTATTNWQFARLFRRRYPKIRLQAEHMLTEDENLICTGAASALFNLGLHTIEKYGSRKLASVCSKALLVDPSRESQAPYMVFDYPRGHGDAEILKAQKWMETCYSKIGAVDLVADHVGISPRHFKRRFKNATGESPLRYLQLVRIESAKNQLETTTDTVNEITWKIGYEDSSTFRRLFKKHTGLSPREYRDKFQRSPNKKLPGMNNHAREPFSVEQ